MNITLRGSEQVHTWCDGEQDKLTQSTRATLYTLMHKLSYTPANMTTIPYIPGARSAMVRCARAHIIHDARAEEDRRVSVRGSGPGGAVTALTPPLDRRPSGGSEATWNG